MDLKQLVALVTVSDTRSVSRAAEVLHLVQPAVTRQIRLMEQELGVALFERSRYGMRPTEAGEVMLDHARRVLHEIERAKAEVRAQAGVVSGLVTVGLLSSTVELLAVRLVESIAEEHPGISLRIRVGYSGDLQQALDRGDVDAALLYGNPDSPALSIRPLLSERLWAVASHGSGLAVRDEVAVEELAGHPLVLPASGQGLRTLLNTAAAGLDLPLEADVETNSMEVQKRLAAAGRHWTVLPACCLVDDIAAGLIEAAPLARPDVERSIVLATARDARARRSVEAVAECLVSLVSSLAAEGHWPSARVLPA